MKKDTAGNIIPELMANCECGLTCGCKRCNPLLFYSEELPERLTNPRYGRDILDKQIAERAKNAPGIKEIHKITDKIPQKVWDEAVGRKRFCKNCGEELTPLNQ